MCNFCSTFAGKKSYQKGVHFTPKSYEKGAKLTPKSYEKGAYIVKMPNQPVPSSSTPRNTTSTMPLRLAITMSAAKVRY